MTEARVVAMCRTESLKVLAQFNDPEMLHWAMTALHELTYTDDDAYIEAFKAFVLRVVSRIDAKRAVALAELEAARARIEAFRDMPTAGVH